MGGKEKASTNSKSASTITPTVNTRSTKNTKNQHQSNKNGSTGTPLTSTPGRSSSISSIDSFELLERKLLKSLSRVIADKFAEFEELISHKLDGSIISLTNEVVNLREELDYVKREVFEIRHELEELRRLNRLTDVVITGVPLTENDNPGTILSGISTVIKHTLSPYSVAFRAKKHNNGKGSSLIAKFSSISEQKSFLQKFKKCGTVELRQISQAFSSDSRISIYESLTRRNQRILRMALGFKKNNMIYSAFTRNGLVYVRVRDGDSPIVLTDEDALNKIVSISKASEGKSPTSNGTLNEVISISKASTEEA